MNKSKCKNCGGIKFDNMEVNRKLWFQLEIYNSHMANNNERTLRTYNPYQKASFYSILNESEDYIKSKLAENDFFCKCLSAKFEKEREKSRASFLERKQFGMSSRELKEKERRDSEWRIINAINNKK